MKKRFQLLWIYQKITSNQEEQKMRCYTCLLVLLSVLIIAYLVEAANVTKLWTNNITEDGRIYGFATWGDGYYGYTTANSVKIFDKNSTMIVHKKMSDLYHYLIIGDNCFLVQRGGDGENCETRMFDFSGNELWSLNDYGISGAMFSPYSNYLVYADDLDDFEFRITNKQGETLLSRKHGSSFVEFSKDEKLLSVTGHGIFKFEGNRVEQLVLDEDLGFKRYETYFMEQSTKILIRERKPVNQIHLYNLQLELLWSKKVEPATHVNVFQDLILCSTKDILEIYTIEGDLVKTLKFTDQKISEEVWDNKSGDYCIIRTYIFPTKEWFNVVDRRGSIIEVVEYTYDRNKNYSFNEKGSLLYTITSVNEENYILECYNLEAK